MQKSSNSYILTFIVVLTVLSGILLAFVSESLKPLQSANIEMEKKKFILTTFMGKNATDALNNEEINNLYDQKVKPIVVDYNGKTLDLTDNDVNVENEYKLELTKRKLPVYEISNEQGELEYIVLLVYGYGLYDNLWGYVAIENDISTIKGVIFDHAGETPGLGARITEEQIFDRYKGKKIRDKIGNIVPVIMQKGEKGGGERSIQAYLDNPHAVDGMSGASFTGNGTNKMLTDYLEAYKNYLNSKIK